MCLDQIKSYPQFTKEAETSSFMIGNFINASDSQTNYLMFTETGSEFIIKVVTNPLFNSNPVVQNPLSDILTFEDEVWLNVTSEKSAEYPVKLACSVNGDTAIKYRIVEQDKNSLAPQWISINEENETIKVKLENKGMKNNTCYFIEQSYGSPLTYSYKKICLNLSINSKQHFIINKVEDKPSHELNGTVMALSIFSWLVLILTIVIICIYKGFIAKEASFVELWNIINYAQLIVILILISPELSETLKQYLKSLRLLMISFNIIPVREIPPINYLKSLLSDYELDERFSLVGLVSTSTMVNMISIISIVALFCLFYLILKFTLVRTKGNNHSDTFFESYWCKQLFSKSNFVRLLVEIYLFLVISVLCEIKTTSSFGSQLMCLLWLGLIVTVGYFAHFIYIKRKNNINIDQDSMLYSFVNELKDNPESYTYSRNLLLKRIIIAIILVYGENIYAPWKCLFIIAIESVYFYLIFNQQPFNVKWANYAEMCNSVFYGLNILFSLLAIYDWESQVLSYFAIGIIILNIIVMCTLNILSAFKYKSSDVNEDEESDKNPAPNIDFGDNSSSSDNDDLNIRNAPEETKTKTKA